MNSRVTLFGEVPDEWKISEIGEVAELKQGLQISKNIRVDSTVRGSIPLLKITDLPSGIYSEYVKDIPENYIASKEDIIYTRTGQVGLVYTNVEGCVHNNCFKVIFDYNNFDKNYIYYYLNSKNVWKYSNSVAGGSVQKDLTHGAFKKCLIAYPKLDEQRAIGKILYSLDEKIETNNQINKRLEQMAQAIFKQWFVDFEFPNEDGETYKSSGGEMVESELGMIPKGWEVKRIGEVGEVVGGGTPSTKNEEYYGGVIPWITPKDLSGYSRKFIKSGERCITELGLKNSSAKLMPQNTVLFSSRAPIGYITIAANTVSTNQGFKSIVCNEELISHNYMYYFLKYNRESIENLASGSTFKEVSGSVMKQVKLVLPNRDILDKFNKVAISIDNTLMKNYDEIDSLLKIRDSLLPKLMSGEIRVPLDN